MESPEIAGKAVSGVGGDGAPATHNAANAIELAFTVAFLSFEPISPDCAYIGEAFRTMWQP